ncbi:MAG TPA: hypothetical protein VLV78_09970 [Thermoanaerobaculia bacterium]|nr:hypothetical protein [Thermoanaerobaculia bacterium]
MAINPQWIWIAAAVIAVLVIVALLSAASRSSRSARLREKFGAEYDYLLDEHGSRRRAEEEMLARAEEAKTFTVRPLSPVDADRFRREWQAIEGHFVERPAMAVSEADELIDQILRTQGYPLGDFERHIAHLSTQHPRLAQRYRAGHNVIRNHAPGETTTEDLRQAMLHFRSLLDELLGPSDVVREVPVTREIATDAGVRLVTTSRERPPARTPSDRSPAGNGR